MFEISYQSSSHSPFRAVGSEFDLINIPSEDYYGVKTAMSEKFYFLPGNGLLQKNINSISSDRSKNDVEISEVLIKEQRMLRKKRDMIRIFGENSLE